MSKFATVQNALRLASGTIGVCWTGQSGFSFKDSEGTVYHIDPYLSNISSRFIGYHRAIPTPVEAREIVGDYFIFSHEHRDHLDTDSVPLFAKNNPNSRLIGPATCISRLLELDIEPNRLITIEGGASKTIGNIELKAVPAYHTVDSVGYVLTFGEIKIYITGDTVYSDDLIAVSEDKPDLMMSCINGRLGCLNIADAVRLTSHIQPRIAIPMHIHMFIENTASADEYIRQVELHSGITKGFEMEHGLWYTYNRTEGLLKLPEIGESEPL
jgi:L-ascorbate 6-phosphate lactonase